MDLRTEGDAVFAIFQSAPAAVSAAVVAQRRVASSFWPQPSHERKRRHRDCEARAIGIWTVRRYACFHWIEKAVPLEPSDDGRALVAPDFVTMTILSWFHPE